MHPDIFLQIDGSGTLRTSGKDQPVTWLNL